MFVIIFMFLFLHINSNNINTLKLLFCGELNQEQKYSFQVFV